MPTTRKSGSAPATRNRTNAAALLVIAGMAVMVGGGYYAVNRNIQAWEDHTPPPAATAAREMPILLRDLRTLESHSHARSGLVEATGLARQELNRLTADATPTELIERVQDMATDLEDMARKTGVPPALRDELTRQARNLRDQANAEIAANRTRTAWAEYFSEHQENRQTVSLKWFMLFLTAVAGGMTLVVWGTLLVNRDETEEE